MQRWIRAASGKGHLDLGERSSKSLRVKAEHVIVTACRAHVDAETSEIDPESSINLCSNCVEFAINSRNAERNIA